MADVVAQAAARTTLTLMLLGIASAVALALGSVGIYGVVSYVVSLRTREIAVRLALGARPVEVRRMVSRQAGVLVALGIAVGLAGAVAVTRVLGALLFGVSPVDPASMLGAAAVLACVAAVGSWVPAHRASTLDPARALRSDRPSGVPRTSTPGVSAGRALRRVDESAIQHDRVDFPRIRNVSEWICVEDQQIGKPTRRNAADLILPP